MKKFVFKILLCCVCFLGAAALLSGCFFKKNNKKTSTVEPAAAEYTVKFSTMGGSTVSEVIVKDGDTLKRPEDPERNGYVFDGWYYNSDYTLAYNFNAKVHKDLTLFASWYDENLSFVQMTDGSYAVAFCDTNATTVDIPSVYKNRKVTTIGEKAFKNCTRLEEIILPDSIEKIESNAFLGCAGLRKLILGSGVNEIAGGAFNGCNLLSSINCNSNSNYFVANNLLIRRAIKKGNMNYENAVVFACGDLANYTIPNNCQTIEPYAFYGKNLDTIKLGWHLSVIGKSAFENCRYLTDVNFASFGTSWLSVISENAFKNCTSLSLFNLPFNVETIGTSAFEGCANLGVVSFQYGSRLRLISDRAFYGCTNLYNLRTGTNNNKLPASVSIIGTLAFANCTNIQKLGFIGGSKLNEIGQEAFLGCSQLRVFDVPARVVSIKNGAFADCALLKLITIPASVTNFGLYVFRNCNTLSNIEVMSEESPDVLTLLENLHYYQGTITVWDGVENDAKTYVENNELNDITITKILTGNLFNLAPISDNEYKIIRYIGTNRETVQVPGTFVEQETGEVKTIVAIADDAFANTNCEQITDILLPNSIREIGTDAFSGCTGLVAISIPASVESVAGVGFDKCTSLIRVSLLSRDTLRVTQLCQDLANQLTNSSKTVEVLRYMKDEIEQCVKENNVSYRVDYIWTIEPIEQVYTFVREGTDENSYYRVTGYAGDYEILYVPDKYNGFDVKVIDADSFADHSEITKLNVPSTVDSIGEGAFSGCSGLAEITLPFVGGSADATTADRTTLLGYIFGTNSFVGATQTQQQYASGSNINSNYYIPNALTKVSITGGKLFYGAFSLCNNLTSVTLGDNVLAIAEGAFYGCGGIEEITLPFVGGSANPTGADRITLLGYIFGTDGFVGSTATTQKYSATGSETYYVPTSLESVTLTGDKLLYGAFYGCAGLTNITIAGGTTEIGKNAFEGCSGLKRVNYAGTIADWCGIVFGNKQSNPLTFAHCLFVDGEAVTDILLSDLQGVSQIYSYAFSGCKRITKVEVPESVLAIGEAAFTGCSGIAEMTLPFVGGRAPTAAEVEVTNTRENLFGYVFGTESYEGGKEIKQIYDYELNIDEEDIENSEFEDDNFEIDFCIPTSLKKVTVTSFNIPCYAFAFCESITDIEICEGITKIGVAAFGGCKNLDNIILPNSITDIGYVAFAETGLTDISILPSGLTKINVGLFLGCEKLKSVFIPDSITEIKPAAFADCSTLTSVRFGENSRLQSIGQEAFYECFALSSITIPAGVTEIGKDAFEYCFNLVEVVNKSNLDIVAGSTENGYIAEKALVVASGSDANSYVSRIRVASDGVIYYEYEGEKIAVGIAKTGVVESLELEEGCTRINELAFARTYHKNDNSMADFSGFRRPEIISVTLPSTLEEIGDYAFDGCKLVEIINRSNLNIEKGSKEYGYVAANAKIVVSGTQAQTYTTKLEVTDNGVVYWHRDNDFVALKYLYAENDEIREIVLDERCTEIYEDAFYYCWFLKKITIPASVITIGKNAFASCNELYAVEFLGNSALTTISDNAFYGCGELTSITIPVGVTTIEDGAFSGCNYLVEVINKSGLNIEKGSEGFGGVARYAIVVVSGEEAQNYTSGVERAENGILYLAYDENFVAFGIEKSGQLNSSLKESEGLLTFDSRCTEICAMLFRGYSETIVDVIIPANVKIIGYRAFDFCTNLESVIFEAGSKLETIEDCAFANCSKLTEITIPKSVKVIGPEVSSYPSLGSYEGAFGGTGLRSVTFEEGSELTLIGWCAFHGCESLTSITIPENVTKICEQAFGGCYRLVEVVNKSVITIAKGSTGNGYVGRYALNVVNKAAAENYISKIVTAENGVQYFDDGANYIAFNYVGDGGAVTLDSRCKKINQYAFYEKANITSVQVPSGVTEIGAYSFYECTSLNSVNIPEGVTKIESCTFSYCPNLTSITIPSSVQQIGDLAFRNCRNLVEVINKSTKFNVSRGGTGNGYVGEYALVVVNGYAANSYQSRIVTVNDVKYYNDGFNFIALAYVGEGTEIVIDSRCAEIHDYAFLNGYIYSNYVSGLYKNPNLSKITKVTISEGVRKIGKYAFGGCYNINFVNIPHSVNEIGEYIFESCKINTIVIDSANFCYLLPTAESGRATFYYYADTIYVLKSIVGGGTSDLLDALNNESRYTRTDGMGEYENYYVYSKVNK